VKNNQKQVNVTNVDLAFNQIKKISNFIVFDMLDETKYVSETNYQIYEHFEDSFTVIEQDGLFIKLVRKTVPGNSREVTDPICCEIHVSDSNITPWMSDNHLVMYWISQCTYTKTKEGVVRERIINDLTVPKKCKLSDDQIIAKVLDPTVHKIEEMKYEEKTVTSKKQTLYEKILIKLIGWLYQ